MALARPPGQRVAERANRVEQPGKLLQTATRTHIRIGGTCHRRG